MYKVIDWWDGGYEEITVFEGSLKECEKIFERFDEFSDDYGECGVKIIDEKGNVIRE